MRVPGRRLAYVFTTLLALAAVLTVVQLWRNRQSLSGLQRSEAFECKWVMYRPRNVDGHHTRMLYAKLMTRGRPAEMPELRVTLFIGAGAPPGERTLLEERVKAPDLTSPAVFGPREIRWPESGPSPHLLLEWPDGRVLKTLR